MLLTEIEAAREKQRLRRTAWDWWRGVLTTEQRIQLMGTYFPKCKHTWRLSLDDITDIQQRTTILGLSQEWLKAMSADQWTTIIDQWKKVTKDYSRLDWSPAMIATSTIAVERVYREMVLGENFK